jgi:hypothetical protein
VFDSSGVPSAHIVFCSCYVFGYKFSVGYFYLCMCRYTSEVFYPYVNTEILTVKILFDGYTEIRTR